MSHRCPDRLVVLHGLRVKGVAEPAALAAFTGLPEPEVSESLARLSRGGSALHRRGAIPGWRLTEAGRTEHADALAADGAESAAMAMVTAGFERFAALDGSVKAICTAWQMRDLEAGVVNDHRDHRYDATVASRLATVHAAVVALVADLAAAMARFGAYGSRFDSAHVRFRSGDGDALARPLTGSYHDVWMELHEDLLLTLGRPR